MTPRESEQRWESELERLAAERQARVTADENELRTKLADAESRIKTMTAATIARYRAEQQARLDAYEAETRRLLEEDAARWQSLLDSEGDDISSDCASALRAILGEGGDAR